MFEHGQSTIAVAGYAVMRLAWWLRPHAAGDPDRRRTCLTYAAGITLVQLLWIARLGLDDARWIVPTFVVLMAAELAVPPIAETLGGRTPWHPHHIAERYSLFTIIVLGEVILSTVVALQEAPNSGHLLVVAIGAMLVVFSCWWIYFKRDHWGLFTWFPTALAAGYGHLLVFASVAATGAGLAASVDVITHDAHASETFVGYAIAVPVAAYCLLLGGLHVLEALRPGGEPVGTSLWPALRHRPRGAAGPAAAAVDGRDGAADRRRAGRIGGPARGGRCPDRDLSTPAHVPGPDLGDTPPMDSLHTTTWRRLAVWPLAAVVLGIALLVLLGFLVDMSGLDQGQDSWGFLFAGVVLSVFYGAPLLVVVLVLTVIARVVADPVPFVWISAVLVALAAVALLVAGWSQLGGPPAAIAFAGRDDGGRLAVCWFPWCCAGVAGARRWKRSERRGQSLRSRT